MPTREDVLRIRSIEEAFDLSTTKLRKHEVALIRVAERERLIRLTVHARDAAEDEAIDREEIWNAVRSGTARSKDRDPAHERQVGVNFETVTHDGRRIRVKVSWDLRYFIATVHTV